MYHKKRILRPYLHFLQFSCCKKSVKNGKRGIAGIEREGFLRNPKTLQGASLGKREGFLRNPYSLPTASCAKEKSDLLA